MLRKGIFVIWPYRSDAQVCLSCHFNFNFNYTLGFSQSIFQIAWRHPIPNMGLWKLGEQVWITMFTFFIVFPQKTIVFRQKTSQFLRKTTLMFSWKLFYSYEANKTSTLHHIRQFRIGTMHVGVTDPHRPSTEPHRPSIWPPFQHLSLRIKYEIKHLFRR